MVILTHQKLKLLEDDMSIQEKLDQKVDQYRILSHPFYEKWSEGKTPVEKLKRYAEEYGAFISLMPMGWKTLNDHHTVEEEEEHIELWEKFANSLGTKIGVSKINEIQSLIDSTNKLFNSPETAIGALYAFEVQQPETATSKLDGLRKFYDLSSEADEYFIEHTHNHHEAEKLINLMESLSKEDQEKAIMACEEMSKALWDGLTGIDEEQILH